MFLPFLVIIVGGVRVSTYIEGCSTTVVSTLSHGDVVLLILPDNVAHLTGMFEGAELKISKYND